MMDYEHIHKLISICNLMCYSHRESKDSSPLTNTYMVDTRLDYNSQPPPFLYRTYIYYNWVILRVPAN